MHSVSLRSYSLLVYFDGEAYRNISDESVIGKAGSFEFGCIFEIGRLICSRERPISFTANKFFCELSPPGND
jgi:hypothetical protein